MEVFSDGAGGSENFEPSEWGDLGTRDSRKKENVVESTPWKGETIPQKRAGLAPRTPKLEVFKDTVGQIRPGMDTI
jgi:checkpoint serine/threonine-protein kinase